MEAVLVPSDSPLKIHRDAVGLLRNLVRDEDREPGAPGHQYKAIVDRIRACQKDSFAELPLDRDAREILCARLRTHEQELRAPSLAQASMSEREDLELAIQIRHARETLYLLKFC